MQIVYNLAVSVEKRQKVATRTLPLSVVAAKSFAAASAEFDSSIAMVVVHASCYAFPSAQIIHKPDHGRHTDFWNCSRN